MIISAEFPEIDYEHNYNVDMAKVKHMKIPREIMEISFDLKTKTKQ